MTMMRLTHVTIKNWRNFKQADFDLQDRMLIIGPNASGKSNLLDALRFLGQIASAGGGFQNAVDSRGGMARLRCLAARYFNKGRVTLRITVGDDECPSTWAYEVTFTAEQRGKRRPIVYEEVVESNERRVLTRPTDADRDDPERMTQTHLEQVNANREFRPIVDFLRSVRYLHLVPHLIRDPERGGERLSRVRRAGGPQVLLTTHSNDVLADPGLGKDEVVILTPGEEGTEAHTADAVPDIQALLDSDLSLAEILSPRTAPGAVQELPNRIAQR